MNVNVGSLSALIAGTTQGLYSFVLTLSLSYLLDTLMAVCGGSRLGIAGTMVTASASLFVVAYLLQWSVGTRYVVLTILPGWIIGSIYAALYTSFSRPRHRPADLPASGSPNPIDRPKGGSAKNGRRIRDV